MSERIFRIVVVVLLAGWLAIASWQASRQASNGRFQYHSGNDGSVVRVLDTRTGGFYSLDDRKNANGETLQLHSVYMNLSTGEVSVVPFNTANYMEQYGKLKPIPNK